MLVTFFASNLTSSHSVRLVPCTMLPSMVCLSPSGLMIWPQSWATVNLRAQIFPLARSISTSATMARRGPRLPARLFGRGLDHRDVARVLDVTQAEFDGIEVERRRHLVHERLAGEMDLRSDRIAQMRATQRRAALEQRRNGLPREPLVRELVGLGGDAEAVGGFELGAAQLPRQRVLGRAAVGVHVDAREAFAH